MKRRNFVKLLGLLAGGVCTGSYARFIEPTWLETTYKTVHLPNYQFSPPIRLLHLADLHAFGALSMAHLQEAIELSLTTKPDLICLTGDFIAKHIDDVSTFQYIFSKLSAAAPTFACLGNHDGGAWAAQHGGYQTTLPVRELLEKSSIVCLHNAVQALTIHSYDFYLVGLGDSWTEDFKPEIAFKALPETISRPVILLSHNPDSKESVIQYPWDLMLCGHTHGGQVVIPFWGPTPFVPVSDKRFVAGLYTWENRLIHITRGIGIARSVKLRFNCRPEISLLKLV